MSRLIVPFCIIVAFIQTSFAHEQMKKVSYSVNAGLSLPSAPDDFSDFWKTGFNIGGAIGYPLEANLAFQACLDYSSFTYDKDRYLSDYGFPGLNIIIDGGNTSIFTASANLKVMLSPHGSFVSPYFIGGLGFLRLSLSDMTRSFQGDIYGLKGASETAIAVFFGAGFDFVINERVIFFAEGKYGVGFTEDESTQYFPIKFGLAFK